MSNYILRPDAETVYDSILSHLADKSKTWKVTISEYKSTRSQEQNAYYWAAVLPAIAKFIFEVRGDCYTPEDIHEFYRESLLPPREVTIKGVTKVIRPSTRSLSVGDFAEYLDKVIAHASTGGVPIPPPAYSRD